jgi:hypothetical protein
MLGALGWDDTCRNLTPGGLKVHEWVARRSLWWVGGVPASRFRRRRRKFAPHLAPRPEEAYSWSLRNARPAVTPDFLRWLFSNPHILFKITAIKLIFQKATEYVFEKLFYNFERHSLKRWGSVTTRPRRLVIRASAAVKSIAPAAVEETASIKHRGLPSGALTASRAFASGFAGFLRGFLAAVETFLAAGFENLALFCVEVL